MEQLELFQVDENGQVFINFESLLLVTDELFVDIIASRILSEKEIIKPKVSYSLTNDSLTIVIFSSGVMSSYFYELKMKRFNSTHVPFHLINEVL